MKANFTRKGGLFSRGIIIALMFFGFTFVSQGQTLLTENFDAVTIGGTSCTSVCAGPTGWINSAATSNGTYWGAHNGSTTSSSTGPSSDHTSGSGRYMYTETSGCSGRTAYLASPAMDFSSYTGMVLEFWYHMYGTSMGTMYVDISTDNGSTWIATPVWSKTGDQGNSWQKATVSLSAYTGAGMTTVKIRFRALTGTSYTSDMSIDDVMIYVPGPMTYVSCTTTQNDTSMLSPGDNNQVIIGVEVVTSGVLTPLSVSQLNFNTTGTTSAADIANAKVFYTGSNSNFSSTVQFGSTAATPSGAFNVTGTQALIMGTNYFWLVYDVASSATVGNLLDAQCTQVTISGTTGAKTPTVTNPSGARSIQLVKTIGNGAFMNTSLPIEPFYGYSYSQTIFSASDLGGAKIIDTLYYYFHGPGWTTPDAVKIYMANTNKTAFSSNSDWIPLSNLTKVYDATSLAPTNNQGWVKFVLTTPFFYTGVGNLVIGFDENTAGYHASGDEFVCSSSTGYVSIEYHNDNTNPNPANPPSIGANRKKYYPNIKMDFSNPPAMAFDTLVVEQNDTSVAVQGKKSKIISVNIATTGAFNAFNVSDLYFNTAGTTSLLDIDSAKVFYTASSNQVNYSNQYGSVITSMTPSLHFTGVQTIANGQNYFWLVYYVKGTATLGNFVDGGLDSAIVNNVSRIPAVSNPSGKRKIAGPYSGTYTLGNDPTDDFSSFNNAKLLLGILGVNGPVTILVDSGSYNESVRFTAVEGASAVNTITFKGLGDKTVVSNSNATSSTRAIFLFNRAKFFVLDSLTIERAASVNYFHGVHFMHQADSITIKNCFINCGGITSSYNGIVASNSFTSYSGSGNSANGCIIDNNIITGGYVGIAFRGTSNSVLCVDNHFTNNKISAFSSYGILNYYQNAAEISANEITSSSNTNYNAVAIASAYCKNGLMIAKNKIDLQKGNLGILLDRHNYYTPNQDTAMIANNFVHVDRTLGGNGYGIVNNYSKNAKYYNNSVNITGNHLASRAFVINNSSSTGLIVKNNIFVNNAGGYAFYSTTSVADYENDYNNLYTLDTIFCYQGSNNTNLAAWQTVTSDAANSKSINPSFFSNSDLHTYGIAMNNLGTPIAAITDDIDGDARNATTPDMGADEYTPPANDMAVVEWIAPTNPISLTAGDSIKVRVVNFGTASQSNIPVKYSIDGGTTVISEVIAGPIASQDTIIYIFNTVPAFNTYGIHACMSYTDISNEQNYNNDTVFHKSIACSPFSGAYTLGTSSSSFFHSFSELSYALSNCGISGPMTVYVDSGSYNENVTFTAIQGASATNTITIKGRGAHTVVSNTNASYGNGYIFNFDGAKFFVLDSLTISRASGKNYFWGIHLMNQADSNTFVNNTINCLSTTSTNVNGIVASSSLVNYNQNGNNANGCVFNNNTINGGYCGITIRGNSNSTLAIANVISNNSFNGQHYYGIYTYYQDSIQINNNIIQTDNNTNSSAYAMYIGYCKNEMNISNNKIDMTKGKYGLYIYHHNYSGTGNDTAFVYNNFVHLNANSTSIGINNTYSKNIKYYYNSVNITGNSTSSKAMNIYNSSSKGLIIKNNIFANNAGGYAVYSNSSASNFENNYNNLYTSGSKFCYQNANKTTLAAWQSATSDGANSVKINPLFVSNGDLHTHSTAMSNLGTPLAEVTLDIDGDTRSTTVPDMGADEYVTIANDLSVIKIISTIDPTCGANPDSILVVVKNFGSATQTGVPVNLVGTTPAGSFTYSGIISSIASLAIDTVHVGNVVATAPGAYFYKAYATLATDAMNTNDTLTISKNVKAVLAVDYVENFETSPYSWYSIGMNVGLGHGKTGKGMYKNFYSTATQHGSARINKKIGTIPANASLVFDYHIVNYSGGAGTALDADSFFFMVSNNCGASFDTLFVVDSISHSATTDWVHKSISMASYVGDEVIIAFSGQWVAGDYYFDIDNFGVATPPSVDLGPDTAACTTYTFDAGAGAGYTYMWTYGNDTLATTTQTLTTDSSGVYAVIITGPAGVAYDTVNLTINQLPVVSFTGLANNYCNNDMAATLVGLPTGGTFSGNGVATSMFDPSLSGLGQQFITYSYTDNNACTNTIVDTTIVLEAPVAVMTQAVAFCTGDSAIISAAPATVIPGIFFSQYIEGSSSNKALELYNASTDTIALDGYLIKSNYNGNSPWTGTYKFPVGAKLAPSDVWVLANENADPVILAVADDTLAYNAGGYVASFNGNDVRGLFKIGTTDTLLIDIIGANDLSNPGSGWDIAGVTNGTKDHTLIRKSTVLAGNNVWTSVAGTDSVSSQYLVYPKNDYTGIGSHSVTAPTLSTNSYLWSTGDTTSSITVKPTVTTTYYVTVSNVVCSDIDSVVVTVNPIPVVNLGADKSFKWTNGSVNLDAGNPNAAWTWSTGETTQTVTYDKTNFTNGSVNTVYVDVVENSCAASDTIIITVIDDVSIENTLNNVAISVYPNPNNGMFNLTIEGFNGEFTMEIIDIAGQVIYSENLEASYNFTTKVDKRNIAKGVYYIKLSNNDGVKTQKLIIK